MPNPTPARLPGVVGMGAAVMAGVAAPAARWCAMAVAVPPLPKDSSQPSVLRQEVLRRWLALHQLPPLLLLLPPWPRPLPRLRRNRNPRVAPAVAAQLPLVSRWLVAGAERSDGFQLALLACVGLLAVSSPESPPATARGPAQPGLLG
jgi:hypothetical protein